MWAYDTMVKGDSGVSTCWCSRPTHAAEVECSVCRRMIHYECLGISLNELSILINQEPGLYSCKLCASTLNKKSRDALQKSHSGNTLFEFCSSLHADKPPAASLNAIDAHLQKLATLLADTTKVPPSPIQPEAARSFADAAATSTTRLQRCNSPSTTTTQSNSDTGSKTVSVSKAQAPRILQSARTTNPQPQKPLRSDPSKTLVVARLEDLKRFQPQVIKATLTGFRPSSSHLIKQARLIANGKLLIEATTEVACAELLKNWPSGCFGKDATIKRLNDPSTANRDKTWLIAFDIDKEADPKHVEKEFQRHHPTIENLVVLPSKGGTKAVAKFCVPAEEADNIIREGCFADFCHHRVSRSYNHIRRCFNCQRYGHVAGVCRSKKRCSQCGSSDQQHPNPCTASPRCCNCNGDHPAYSKHCSEYTSRATESSDLSLH